MSEQIQKIQERVNKETAMNKCGENVRPLRILSLGLGVQSSCIALMMKHGEIEPADAMIFADTCCEPKAVYTHLSRLVTIMSTPSDGAPNTIPFIQVTHGAGLTAALEASCRGENTAPLPPLYLLDQNGKKGMLMRVCTERFKIRVIRKKVRELLVKGQRCVMVRGISTDEAKRAKPSPLKYIDHEHPLLDLGMSRSDCLRWMVSHGYPQPPRSACVYCPYRCNAEWAKMRDLSPEDWEEACRMDELMRHGLKNVRGTCFVHSQRVPLREALIDDDTVNHNEGAGGAAAECEGLCGV